MSRASTIKLLLAVAAGVLAGYIVWRVIPDYFQGREDPRSAAYLSKVAADLNRSVPMMIDKETELLPTAATEGMFIYNYRLVSYSASQLDAKKFAAGAKQKLTLAVCNTPQTRDEFLKKGVTLRYSYYDKDKQPIASVDVTPGDCGFK